MEETQKILTGVLNSLNGEQKSEESKEASSEVNIKEAVLEAVKEIENKKQEGRKLEKLQKEAEKTQKETELALKKAEEEGDFKTLFNKLKEEFDSFRQEQQRKLEQEQIKNMRLNIASQLGYPVLADLVKGDTEGEFMQNASLLLEAFNSSKADKTANLTQTSTNQNKPLYFPPGVKNTMNIAVTPEKKTTMPREFMSF